MLSKERFLFLLRYGFAYVDRKIELEDGSKTTQLEKHVMRYQQLFASLAIRKKLDNGIKSGIIWQSGIHKAVEKQPWHIIPYVV